MKFRSGLVLLFLAHAAFAQLPVTQMVVFGDSLSDNGNLYYGTTLLGDPTPGPPEYATGEYTDGVNSVPSTTSPLGLWIEQLAEGLGLPVPQPYAKGGLNYAVASALTGSDPAFTPDKPTVPWSSDQVGLFLKAVPNPPANYLYVFWFGANDIYAGVSPATAVSNLQSNIATLAKAGAKYFLWIDLPALGTVPQYANTSQEATFNAAASAFNTAWTAAIAQLKTQFPNIVIVPFDANSGFNVVLANPALYGFTNVTAAAQGQNVNPNTYFFWDELHPTTTGHLVIAGSVYNQLATTLGGLPAISSISNAFSTSAAIAPNTWVAVKGSGLAPAGDSRTWAAADFVNGQMPQSLDGVSVAVNGEKAYIYYISPTQLNILTPPDIPSGPLYVQVTANGHPSVPVPLESEATSLSFFTFDGANIVATHLNGSDIGPSTLYPGLTTPAQPGEEVVIYATGFGVTSVPVTPGSSTQSGTLATMPVVTIGGMPVNVIFAGLVSPGTFQINAFIPSNTSSGELSITASYNGATTQTGVVIAVQ